MAFRATAGNAIVKRRPEALMNCGTVPSGMTDRALIRIGCTLMARETVTVFPAGGMDIGMIGDGRYSLMTNPALLRLSALMTTVTMAVLPPGQMRIGVISD